MLRTLALSTFVTFCSVATVAGCSSSSSGGGTGSSSGGSGGSSGSSSGGGSGGSSGGSSGGASSSSGSSSGGASSGGDGGGNVQVGTSCTSTNDAGLMSCVEFYGQGIDADQGQCTGMFAPAGGCTATGLVGCCTISMTGSAASTEYCYYSQTMTASDCSAGGGIWSTTPPAPTQ
jgi:hypothetical protein